MNSILKITCLFAVYALISSCQSAKKDVFGELAQIEGTWSMPAGNNPEDGFIIESWVKVNDTLIAGKSYEVTDGDSTLTETIQLISTGTDLFYIPTVHAQNNSQPVKFRLTKNEGNRFTFENPDHDFPTVITYDFQNDSTLKASISGTINGELKAMDFGYIRR